MLKMIGRFLGLGLLGIAMAITTVAIIKGTSNQHCIELKAKEENDKGVEIDEDRLGVELLRFS